MSVEEPIGRYNRVTNKNYHLDVASLPSRLGRAQSFGLLSAAFPDDVAEENDINKFAGLGEARNRSLLAHGLSRLSTDTVGKLIENTERLFARMPKIEAAVPSTQIRNS